MKATTIVGYARKMTAICSCHFAPTHPVRLKSHRPKPRRKRMPYRFSGVNCPSVDRNKTRPTYIRSTQRKCQPLCQMMTCAHRLTGW